MSYIKSRKNAPARPYKYPSLVSATALTVLTSASLGLPAAALAQAAAENDNSAATLPTITVTGASDNPYKPTDLSSPKFTQPIVDTTQTVQVITKQVIKEQGATTLTDAMRNVPGAGTFAVGENGSTNTGDYIYMRGIDTSNSIYIDGIRDTSQAHRDMFNTESVEVIEGPSGSDYGRGAPSGSINMVSKQPHLGNNFDASMTLGTTKDTRPTIDWNQQLTDHSAFRLNTMGLQSDVAGRNTVENNRWGVAPSLALGLGTENRVFIDYLHVKQTNVPDGGVPTVGLPSYTAPALFPFMNGAPTPSSSNFYGSSQDHDYATTDMATIRLEHDFNDTTTLRNTTRWAENKQNYLLSSFSPLSSATTPYLFGSNGIAYGKPGTNIDPSNPSTWYIAALANYKDYSNSIWSNQTNLTSKLNTGSFKHDISAGFEITREKQYNYGNNAPSLPVVNLYNPSLVGSYTVASPVQFGRNGIDSVGTTTTTAIYAFDTIELNDRWQVNGGMRLDHYTTNYNCVNNPTSTATTDCLGASAAGGGAPGWNSGLSTGGNLINWKLGALYRVAPNGNVYVNYAISQQPPGGSTFSLANAASTNTTGTLKNVTTQSPLFAPQKAKTAELGTKWELFDKKMLATAVLFRTDIFNNVLQNADGTYSQVGQQRVEGLQLGLAGMVTDKWAVNAGYTYQHTAYVNAPPATGDGTNSLPYTPTQALSLWTTYKLPHDVTVGGGANYVGGLNRNNGGAIPGSITYSNGYWVFNAMADYKVNKNLDLQLNIYNLFNKQYVSAINNSGMRYFPGVGRYATVTASLHY